MMSAKKKDEVQEVINPVGIRAKVDGALREKIDALIQAFEDERGKYLAELASLDQALKFLEEKKANLMKERGSMASGIFGVGGKGVFDLDMKLRSLEKETKSCQKQIDGIFSRLTEIPELDFPFLNFLSRYKP